MPAEQPSTETDPITVSRAELAAVYAEQQRRFRANPSAYMTADEVAAEDLATHGARCADHLIQVLGDIRAAR